MAKRYVPITFILEIDMDAEIIESDMVRDAIDDFTEELSKFKVIRKFNNDDYKHYKNTMTVKSATAIYNDGMYFHE